MACGWTPDLMRMLDTMADEKHRLAAQAAQELEATTQQLEAAKKRHPQTERAEPAEPGSSQGSDPYNWTSVYGKWDAYQDPEELAQREQAAREKQQSASRAAAAAGCNHDHSAEQKLMDMTTREKLTKCDEFRKLGNAFFTQGQYQRAAYNYHKALVYFEYLFPETEEEENEMDQIKLKTLLNFTACRLKTGHIDDAIHHAEMALRMDEQSVKALYRRAQGYRLKDEFENALADITAAIAYSQLASQSEKEQQEKESSSSVDPLLAAEKQLLQAKMLAYKYKSRQVSAAMFGCSTPRREEPKQQPVDWKTQSMVNDVPLQLRRAEEATRDSNDDWHLNESWRPSTAGKAELQQLLETL